MGRWLLAAELLKEERRLVLVVRSKELEVSSGERTREGSRTETNIKNGVSVSLGWQKRFFVVPGRQCQNAVPILELRRTASLAADAYS